MTVGRASRALMPEDEAQCCRFDPVDLELMRLRGRLSPGQRIRSMLDTRELLVGLIRGRLRRHYPHLSPHELNLRMLEEIEHVKRAAPGP